MTEEAYLKQIDHVISEGTYKDDWASLSQHETPMWYQNAKFGIFTHWGVYSVQAYGNEWYSRTMYLEGHANYAHHLKTYGAHKDFGYADFIPLFKGEHFDAKVWLDLFEDAGAKYYMPVAEHHDGFQMYDSQLSDWNAAKMGPCRDILGELKQETEKRGMTFASSSHRAENYWFMSGARDFDSGIQDIEFQEPYGFCVKLFELENQHETTHNIHTQGPSKAHLENWLARSCELVDKYQPQIVWFDWWIHNVAFKPYLKKFAAYYYNRALEWGKEVAINYKYDAFARGTAVYDIERGQCSDIRPDFWQTDTSVAKNSWSYTENNDYKTAESLVCDLIDIVSKNGTLLLNIGPKADGTIPEEDANILKAIGSWLKINGESIYDTTYWSIYGEGPTKILEGAFTDKLKPEYTCEDVRYTYRAPYLYANILKFPNEKKIGLTTLAAQGQYFKGHISSVEVLGSPQKLQFEHTQKELTVKFSQEIDSTFPVCLKITID